MKQSKLRRIHVIIIGAVVCVLVGVGMFFVMIKPAKEQLATEKARLDQYAPTGTQANVDMAKKDLAAALVEVAEAQNSLDRYMKAKMPNVSFADRPGTPIGSGRVNGMFDLWTEQTQVLGPLLADWAQKHGPVRLASAIAVPAPPFNPNDPMFEQDVIKVPVGKVKISGSYQAIMKSIESWKACGRLVDINAVTFTGNSPKLDCEYDVNVYIMPRFKATKPLTIAGGPAGAAGGAGVPSGPAPPPPAPASTKG